MEILTPPTDWEDGPVTAEMMNTKINDLIEELQAAAYAEPPGVIKVWTGSVAPDGYLLCDGQQISISQYPDLYAVIGTTYGSDVGTFAVPNLKGRVVVGYDPSQAEFNTVGETGGSKTDSVVHSHTLDSNGQAAITLLASHPSVVTRRVATQTWTANVSVDTTIVAAGASGSNTLGAALLGRTANETVSTSTVQPYAAMPYIIKT